MDTKKLRQKILDLAIRGKLVPQDPNDEPASVLLERIRAEKERLVKEGKIKKSKASKTSDTPHYEQVPFEVPKGWCWCKLDDLAFYKKGPFGSSLTKSMFVPDSPDAYKVYEQKNAINKNATLGQYFIDKAKFEELKGFAVQPEDIIVSCAGTIGETYVLPQNIREGIINQALMTIRLFDKSISDFYLLYFDFILKNEAANESKGTAIKNIPPFDILKNFFFPLPPLEEQNRIIEKVSYWLSFVNAIDSEGKEMGNLISKTKSKILDLAIHGKLVPQDPNDEPASELLKRINPNAEITCDNGQYGKLPDGWGLIMISQVVELLSGRDLTSNDCNEDEEGVPYLIGASNIVNNHLNITRWTKNPQVISSIGDILISCKGTIGEIVLNDIGNIHIARQFMAIRPNKNSIITEYFQYYLLAMVHNIKDNARGVIPGISREDILTKYFPLPPLAEQQRIVDAIDKAFAKFDAIMESL